MARIAGITLPSEKRIEVGLTYIFGIGRSKALKILAEAKIDKDKKVKALTEDEVNTIRQIIEKREKIEGDLRKEVTMNMPAGTFRPPEIRTATSPSFFVGSMTGAPSTPTFQSHMKSLTTLFKTLPNDISMFLNLPTDCRIAFKIRVVVVLHI